MNHNHTPIIGFDHYRLPYVSGMEFGESYFPSIDAARAWVESNKDEINEPLSGILIPASLCTITAHFRAEQWVNDNAIEVDPEGENTWRIHPDDMIWQSSDTDFLINSRFAPSWVTDWAGPYTINLEIEKPSGLSAHDKLHIETLLKGLTHDTLAA